LFIATPFAQSFCPLSWAYIPVPACRHGSIFFCRMDIVINLSGCYIDPADSLIILINIDIVPILIVTVFYGSAAFGTAICRILPAIS
jgi:hypothetical protein